MPEITLCVPNAVAQPGGMEAFGRVEDRMES